MRSSDRDIEERAFALACVVVTFCDSFWNSGEIQRRLLLQLVDAATSIGSNLEQAVAGGSKPDFMTKLATARKEARETRYWLRVIDACFPQHRRRVAPLLAESSEIVAILAAIAKKARSNPQRGRDEPSR